MKNPFKMVKIGHEYVSVSKFDVNKRFLNLKRFLKQFFI